VAGVDTLSLYLNGVVVAKFKPNGDLDILGMVNENTVF
jgi:hypothetical protein